MRRGRGAEGGGGGIKNGELKGMGAYQGVETGGVDKLEMYEYTELRLEKSVQAKGTVTRIRA